MIAKCPSEKKRFLLMEDARAFSKHVKKEFGRYQQPYLCPHCNNWHLTTHYEAKPSGTGAGSSD